MKRVKIYPTAFVWFFVPLLFGMAAIAALLPELVHYLLYLNNVFLIFSIALLFIPLKKFHQSQIQLNNDSSFFSYVTAFIKISLLQFFLVLTILNFHIVFTLFMPIPASVSFTTLVNANMSHLLHWGLFPWPMLMLVSIALMFYKIKMHRNIGILETTDAIYGKYLQRAFGAGVELFLRQGLIIAASFVMMAIGFTIYFYAIALGMPKISFSPNGYTVIIFLLISIITSNRYWHWFIKQFWKQNFSTARLFLLQMLATVISILILIPLLHLLGENLNANLNQSFLFPIPELPFNYTWDLLTWSFWMGSVVFIAPMIANIAKGKDLRIILIFGLFWPLLLTYLWLVPNFQLSWDKFFSFIANPKVSLMINAIMTLTFCLYFWFNKSFEDLLFSSYYCQADTKYHRLPIKSLAKILRLLSLFLLLYVFDGINLLSLFFFGMVASCFVIYTPTSLGLLKTLWQDR